MQIVRKYDNTDELKLRALTNLINFMFITGKATTLYKYYNNKLYFSFKERATKEKKSDKQNILVWAPGLHPSSTGEVELMSDLLSPYHLVSLYLSYTVFYLIDQVI